MSALIKFLKHLNPVVLNSNESLMQALLRAGYPVASSCHGEGVCGKCRVAVIAGQENLAAVGKLESATAKRNKLQENERLACQAKCAQGEVTLDTTYW